MPKWKSFDFECPACGKVSKNVMVEEGDAIFCGCGDGTNEMRQLPVGGPKNYTWGAGGCGDASTTPAKFRRDKR